MQDRYREALEHASRSLTLFRANGHRVGLARALNAVGECHARLGEAHHALAHSEQALAMLPAHGHNRRAEADIHETLGYIHHQLGQYGKAVDLYRRALHLRSDLDNRYGQATVLVQLANSHDAAGHRNGADTAR